MIYYSIPENILPEIFLAGNVFIPSPNRHFERTPGEHILYYVYSGHMQLIEGDVLYDLHPGDLLILDPANKHYGIETFSDIRYMYIHFSINGISYSDEDSTDFSEIIINNRLSLDRHEKIIFPKHFHFPGINSNLAFERIEAIVKHVNSAEPYHLTKSECFLLDFLLNLGVEYIVGFQNNIKTDTLLSDKILSYLRDNCRSNISSSDIENHFHMNFDHLNRIFKKNTGMTIINYHNRYRIMEAKKLLRSRLYNVRETAEQMGFSNEFYFSRVYKKYEGISPSKFFTGQEVNSHG